jgi:hypothetical protein
MHSVTRNAVTENNVSVSIRGDTARPAVSFVRRKRPLLVHHPAATPRPPKLIAADASYAKTIDVYRVVCKYCLVGSEVPIYR